MDQFDIISATDRPALLAITSPDVRVLAETALLDLGYKVHTVEDHVQFDNRFSQVSYQVVIIEDTFCGSNLLDNPTLRLVQNMPMNLRRNAVVFLISMGFETLNTLQAFSQSVQCVVNHAQLPMLSEIVQKMTAESDLFLSTFREVQRRVYQKG